MGNAAVSQRECEKKLIGLLTHKHIQLVSHLLKNRDVVFFGTCLHKAQNASEKEKIMAQIRQSKSSRVLLAQLAGEDGAPALNARRSKLTAGETAALSSNNAVTEEMLKKFTQQGDTDQKVIDLDATKFEEGGRFMANKKCNLPRGSTKVSKKGYDEIRVPAIRNQTKNERLVSLNELPSWTHKAFPPDMKSLNVIQSRLYDSAFNSA